MALWRQSIVHSAVQFMDGSVKAQLGVPDMRLPIQYAFSFPRRLPLSGDRLDLFAAQHLDFFEPDLKKFRCLAMAYEALNQGGNMPVADSCRWATSSRQRCSVPPLSKSPPTRVIWPLTLKHVA